VHGPEERHRPPESPATIPPVTPSTLAYVTPETLKWARESIGYDVVEAAGKVGVQMWQLMAAEEGAELLTLRQAERAARVYERPLATLFLPGRRPSKTFTRCWMSCRPGMTSWSG